MAELNLYDYHNRTYDHPSTFNLLMVAAQGLNKLSRDTGLAPWHAYLDAYDNWIDERAAEDHR